MLHAGQPDFFSIFGVNLRVSPHNLGAGWALALAPGAPEGIGADITKH